VSPSGDPSAMRRLADDSCLGPSPSPFSRRTDARELASQRADHSNSASVHAGSPSLPRDSRARGAGARTMARFRASARERAPASWVALDRAPTERRRSRCPLEQRRGGVIRGRACAADRNASLTQAVAAIKRPRRATPQQAEALEPASDQFRPHSNGATSEECSPHDPHSRSNRLCDTCPLEVGPPPLQ